MLKLWLVRDRIDREKNIAPMGMTVTRNLCIDRLRRLKTHPHESLTGHDVPDGQRSAQAMMEDRENAEWMRGGRSEAAGQIPGRAPHASGGTFGNGRDSPYHRSNGRRSPHHIVTSKGNK